MHQGGLGGHAETVARVAAKRVADAPVHTEAGTRVVLPRISASSAGIFSYVGSVAGSAAGWFARRSCCNGKCDREARASARRTLDGDVPAVRAGS